VPQKDFAVLTLVKTQVLPEVSYGGHCTDLGRQLQKHFRRGGHAQTSGPSDPCSTLVLPLLGAKGSICTRGAFWPAVVCLKCRRSALLAKGGDGAGVVLAQESVELLSCAGMWPGGRQAVGALAAESGEAFLRLF